jgi:hypothetical protein
VTDFPRLADLEAIPYLDDHGHLPEQFQAKVGIYGIFDGDRVLHYVGYSRDVSLSLKQHLVRQPHACHWVKVATIERPSRTVLDTIRDAWIAENGPVPVGNAADAARWNHPIDAKVQMTAAEQADYANALTELGQSKVLKQVARRVEAEILAVLQARGVQADIRFNPKLKDEGLLDLK